MKQKYNWEKLKVEYFESDYNEVTEFLRHVLGTDEALTAGNIKRQTSGWREEKDTLVSAAMKKAKEEIETKLTDEFLRLQKTKKLFLDLVLMRIQQSVYLEAEGNKQVQKTNISIGDLARAITIIKTELGEPTNIAKTFNKNTNNPTVDELIKELQTQNAAEVDPNW